DFETVVLKRRRVLLIKAVEAHIIVKQKARVVGEDFLHASALKLQGLVRMKVDPGFADKERMPRRRSAKILIHRQRVVNGTGCQLSVKAEPGIYVCVEIEPQSVTHARVLLMS